MVKPKTTLAAALAALFPTSSKVISEKLSQEEFNAFGTEVQEAQDRIDAQTEGNQAVAADLTEARTKLTEKETRLQEANSDIQALRSQMSQLQTKADQWDAHKKALDGAQVIDDSTNKKPGQSANNGLSEKEQKHLDEKARLKAMYPGLMAEFDIPVQE